MCPCFGVLNAFKPPGLWQVSECDVPGLWLFKSVFTPSLISYIYSFFVLSLTTLKFLSPSIPLPDFLDSHPTNSLLALHNLWMSPKWSTWFSLPLTVLVSYYWDNKGALQPGSVGTEDWNVKIFLREQKNIILHSMARFSWDSGKTMQAECLNDMRNC